VACSRAHRCAPPLVTAPFVTAPIFTAPILTALLGAAALLATACSAPAPPAASPPAAAVTTGSAATALTLGAEWPTYHGDAARSGAVPDGPDPSSPAVAWRATLDGAVYASPLIARGLVVAATEGGTLYGLDAATGATAWRTHLADPVPADALPCGNISPTVGITGTPVYDPATGQVFAVATTQGAVTPTATAESSATPTPVPSATPAATAGVRHVLFGVDLLTGQIRTNRLADAPGSEPATHLQRGALLLSDGVVYTPYGGNFGDCGAYIGRVVGAPVTGSAPLTTFAVPTPREGGIWGPPGPVGLPGGDLLVTTGNGEAVGGNWDHSDSILRLSPTLSLRDGFAPVGWAQENSVDADLGSTGPVLLPGGRRVIAAGKGGGVYLADVDRLGGVGGQLAQLSGCRSYGGSAVAAASGGGAVAYLPCTEGLTQFTVGADDRMTQGWRSTDVNSSPVLVGHTVWAVDTAGTLHGLDAATGTARAGVSVGAASRFATPAVSGTALVVPTLTGVTAVAITR
jgi:outer membrane protein assembly factor BamB